MTRQDPHIAPANEAAVIVRLVLARLDALETGDWGSVAEAEQQLATWPGGARLIKLCALFRCTEADRALLLTALAPQIEPGLIQRYREVSGRSSASEWLAARLFGIEDQALLHGNSAAARWLLIRTVPEAAGEPPSIEADPAVRSWIHGQLSIDHDLAGAIRLLQPLEPLDNWPVIETARQVVAATERDMRALLLIEALPGTGRATFVACVAASVGQRAMLVSPDAIGRRWTAEHTLRVHRYALVAGAALVWRTPLPENAIQPLGLWPPALQAVTLEPGETAPAPGDMAPFEVRLAPMGRDQRRNLLLAGVPSARQWSEATLETLARRRALTPGTIARLGRIAPPNDDAAISAANQAGAAAMGDLAVRVTGDLDWDDLILPATLKEMLRDLAFEATVRADAWDREDVKRLFSRETGMIALFHGPPGTGKTMAAQVIARALGLDLFRIDCAAVVSKYIGETAKNLRAIFARARSIDAVLFFDEAEALFSRRTEVRDSHDRHANSDTSYLLQLIEGGFDGTAILATNRMGDMDRAFLRRIRYVFEFPRPVTDERTEIWRRAAAALLPDRTGDLAPLWPVLGEVLDITGAQVKTMLLAAHFSAARRQEPIGVDDLLTAAAREYLKEGRSLSPRDIERIRAHA